MNLSDGTKRILDIQQMEKRLQEYQRMYAALLEIKRLFENEKGKFYGGGKVITTYLNREIWNIACRGLGK